MNSVVVITAVGRDRTGIIAALAQAVYGLGGNLDDATMTRLHGAFAAMVSAQLPDGKTQDDARAALAPVAEAMGVTITVQTVERQPAAEAPADTQITVYGADKPGIVFKVAQRLAERGINITDMDTRSAGTPDSPLYVMILQAQAGALDLADDLAALRGELGVDITAQDLTTEAL